MANVTVTPLSQISVRVGPGAPAAAFLPPSPPRCRALAVPASLAPPVAQ